MDTLTDRQTNRRTDGYNNGLIVDRETENPLTLPTSSERTEFSMSLTVAGERTMVREGTIMLT